MKDSWSARHSLHAAWEKFEDFGWEGHPHPSNSSDSACDDVERAAESFVAFVPSW
jgi:hypothetical protein